MGASYFERKRGSSLIVAIILAVVIFIVSWKFNHRVGLKYEFIIFFFLELFILFYALEGKRRKIGILVWPMIVGVAYAVFDKSYGRVILDRVFECTYLWANITAIFLATLIYLIIIAYRKDVLWKGKDDGTHEKEVIELAEEKKKELKESDIDEIEDAIEKIKDSIKVEIEKKDSPKKTSKSKATKKKASTKKKTITKSLDKKSEEESYFYVGDDDENKKEEVFEKDLSEEVSEILDDVESEDDELEGNKKDLSEGMSIDFEKEVEEEY